MTTACEPLELEILPPYIGSAVSPTVDITETTTDVTVTITDFRGEHSYTVDKTNQAIADAVQAASNANTAATNATATANAAAGTANTAAASATSAAHAATAAAGTANTAAQNADAKAALADSKAELANQAATTANTAAQAAEAAKTAANTAAGQATTAAGNADSKAQLANTAAQNADAKAQLADTAAANADTATQAANTATTNATNAAQAANNAADVAIAAAEDMPRLIGTVDTAQAVDDAWLTTIESATVYGKCVQDGTPTPDNPVPVEVVGGKNLLDERNIERNQYSIFNISNTLEPDTTYTFSVYNTTGQYKLYLAQQDKTTTGPALSSGYARVGLSETFTTPSDMSNYPYLLLGGSAAGAGMLDLNAQIERGTSATPYTPYGCIGLQTGETVTPIDLQGHGLAGLRNDLRDYLAINAAGVKRIGQRVGVAVIDGVNCRATNRNPSYNTIRIEPLPYAGVVYPGTTLQPILCDKLPSETRVRLNDGNQGIAVGSDGTTLYAYISELASNTVAEINEWFAENPITVYYPLETPQTIELGTITQHEITPGDTLAIDAFLDPDWSITYAKDPSIVVNTLQSSIAPVEGATASTNYSVGAYLMHGNQLYRVTSAIATGEAIAPGSNCVACTVMGELARLTA